MNTQAVIETTNRLTGEVYRYKATTPDQMLLSLDEVEATLDAYRLLRSKLHTRATDLWKLKMEENSE